MTGTPSGRQLHMNGGATRQSVGAGAFLHEPSRDAARVCGEEAGSKAPVRGTRSVYEAAEGGRGRVGVQSPKVIQNRRSYMRRIGGAKVTRLTPGDLSACLEPDAKQRPRNSRKRSPGRSESTLRQRSEQRATREKKKKKKTGPKLGKPQGERRADRRQQNP